jgi:flavin reductase (DIM6/NTAB) family NADH-FMN oxidoreductase RutF
MQKEVSYSEAILRKYPEQVVIAIARDKAGKANPVTLGWTMITSGTPPMMAIAVAAGHYTVEAVRHSKCFTIAYPSVGMEESVLFFGSVSGRNMDKLSKGGCETEPAAAIDSVLLSDAVANFECELDSEVPAGDHIIFLGRVVRSHENTAAVQRLYVVGSGHKLGPASG